MKKIIFCLLIGLIAIQVELKAQKIDSIFVNLYTDSLKKGTYNYINVDGLLSNGRYLPLDTNHIIFRSDYGKFFGNSLWLDKNFEHDKVRISISRKADQSFIKEFDIYIKKKEDDGMLKTETQILDDLKKKKKG